MSSRLQMGVLKQNRKKQNGHTCDSVFDFLFTGVAKTL